MAVSEKNRKKYLRDADNYDNLKNELGQRHLDILRFIKSQLADWYIAITAVCFAVGGVAITAGTDKSIRQGITHPALFWWGSLLLITNGVFIFFVRKTELERESSDMPNLKKTEADFWTARNIAKELADGDSSRINDFADIRQRAIDDYHKRIKPLDGWRQWCKYVLYASTVDLVFGLLLFPLLMLASQLESYIGVSFTIYRIVFLLLLVLYLVYVGFQMRKSVIKKKAMQEAEQQVKSEIEK